MPFNHQELKAKTATMQYTNKKQVFEGTMSRWFDNSDRPGMECKRGNQKNIQE
jgi:hypothetical protein